MWSYSDSEHVGSRTSRPRKHTRSHPVHVYPGVMFSLISCLHTSLWWDWQSSMVELRPLEADSRVLYCLRSTRHVGMRRGCTVIQVRRNAHKPQCKQPWINTKNPNTHTHNTHTHIYTYINSFEFDKLKHVFIVFTFLNNTKTHIQYACNYIHFQYLL